MKSIFFSMRCLAVIGGAITLTVVASGLGAAGGAEAGPPGVPLPAPIITGVFPPGLQRGTTTPVTVTGRGLAGVREVRIRGDGVSAEIARPAGAPREDPGTVAVQLRAAANADPGLCELRLIGPGGLSNVGRLVVGTLTELVESEPNDNGAMELRRLPTVINGTIERNEDRDRYRFHATAGQQYVFDLCAKALHPFPEAGDEPFAGVLTLRDAAGRPLVVQAASLVRPDPVLTYKFEQDGPYVIEVRHAAFRGRREFTYRLTIGELPFITRVFPAGGKLGTTPRIRLDGVNLGGATIKEVALPAGVPSGPFRFSVETPNGPTNRVRLLVGDDREFVETEPNDTTGHATSLSLPCVANGVIERDGDVDCYRFSAGKGQRLIFASVARALGSPMEAKLELLDDRGRQLQLLNGVALNREPTLDHTFVADGSYVIRVSDARGYGGPLFLYRLEVRPPRPDFALTVSPDNPRAAAGGTAALTVTAQRRDGFEGDIVLSVPGLPAGFAVSPAVVTGRQTETVLTITVPDSASPAVLPLTIRGTANMAGTSLVHAAIPVEAMLSADRPREFAVSEMSLSTTPPGPFALAWSQPEIRMAAGGKAEATLHIRRTAGFVGPLRVALQRLPRELTSSPVNVGPNDNTARLVIWAAGRAPPGLTATYANGTAGSDNRTFVQSSPVLRIQVSPSESR